MSVISCLSCKGLVDLHHWQGSMLNKFQLTRTKQTWNGLLKEFTNSFCWHIKHCWLPYWNFVLGVQKVKFDIQFIALVVNITCGTSFWKYVHSSELWHDVFAYVSVFCLLLLFYISVSFSHYIFMYWLFKRYVLDWYPTITHSVQGRSFLNFNATLIEC